jgi:translocation and assembly module TamB
LPKVLTPMGALKMDVAMQPGGKLDGRISLQNATTQPVGPFGAIREINTDLHLLGHTIALERFAATIGGEPVQASGTVDMSGSEWMNRDLPPFKLQVKGENLPLVRQPEVIIRSDLDLTLVHDRTKEPLISGVINLRDSFYTSDLESLIPGKVLKPSQRPPYFSVEAEPLANWRLDCQVKGHDFMKLRTPFFKGAVSADFKLEGTLREPFASGEAKVSHGQVNFPFGTLEVNQGLVSVTAANPYQPTLYATARARRYGYDITMEVTGSGDKPVMQFSSVPSLTSEQLLLLLTAGEIPRDDLTFSPQQKAQRFAIFLGQRLLAKLGFGGGEDRLLIRSGEDISESGRTTYDVEYKLDRNWSLVGQYDRFNAFNLSVKRRLYSR